ncbi:chitobiase/beta-hexosaminidase C-terminal domain-containing protein [Eubacterium sp. 1001713B170207_170306_E7]|uniref:chitobiase/beta-hexosaminidase C-terminal domain-containing protein n=1 Tax=Eubacterium sp. 1001713B170207_170306_E7 TaxID=2787097 RepID=UPI0018971BAD|nr:chitobiase/beta-hexosaminidase C-terminal domain-containing protein [Eubacterium sp. 1001713B170207_170306_E7]
MKKKNLHKLFFALSLTSVLLLAGCTPGESKKAIVLDAPTYSLNAGTYAGEQQVTINPPEGEEVAVYYTLDGSNPTKQSTKYESPVSIQTTLTLKSYAVDKNGNTSDIKSAEYIISAPAATPAPKKEMTADEELTVFKQNVQGRWSKPGSSRLMSIKDNKEQYGREGTGLTQYIITYEVESGSNGEKGYLVSSDGKKVYVNCSPMGDGLITINGEEWLYVSDEPLKEDVSDEEFSY